MSRICESCGRSPAKLFAFWPATLCPLCVQQRVDASGQETVQDATTQAPDPIPAKQAYQTVTPVEKRARKRERKEAAIAALARFRETFGLQCALIRLLHRGGAEDAAMVQSQALLLSFIRLGYVAISGAKTFHHSIDRMAASLRVSDLIDDDEMTALIAAIATCERDAEPAGLSTGKILAALELIAIGPPEPGPFASKSLKRRQVREAERAVRHYDPQAFEPIGRDDVEQLPETIAPGKHHRLKFARPGDEPGTEMSVGGKFDDTPEGLRALANAVIGLQDRLPDGMRIAVENVEPWSASISGGVNDGT